MIAATRDVELDTGPRDGSRTGSRSHGLERMCVATRTVKPVADMIRFVVGPDGEAVADLKCKLPGRGVWVTATHDALADAIKRKALVRGFKREVRLPADLVARTEQLLERAALDALAMAGKAGLVATGFAKVEAALQHDKVVTLLHAAEASPDGVRKLDAARHRSALSSPVVTDSLTSAQLDLALGRANVIHAAVLAGPPSDTFLARLQRLERFRTGDQAGPAARVPN